MCTAQHPTTSSHPRHLTSPLGAGTCADHPCATAHPPTHTPSPHPSAAPCPRGRHVRIGGRAWSDSDRTVSPSPRHPEGGGGGSSGRSPRFGDQYYGEHEGDEEEEEEGAGAWAAGCRCLERGDCCCRLVEMCRQRVRPAAVLRLGLLFSMGNPCSGVCSANRRQTCCAHPPRVAGAVHP